jgi:multicomponent Na+:H+ antiporter subunit D
MMSSLPPGMLMVVGAFLLPFLQGRLRQGWMLALPLLSAAHLLALPVGHEVELMMVGYELMPVRVDRLSLVWGYVFHIAAFLSVLYSLHVKDRVQDVAGLAYAGTAIGAAFAGDLITLFVFWELTAITSVFLIWAKRTERAIKVGTRYLILQVGSGVILLAGVVLHVHATGDIGFGHLGWVSPGTTLILIAFGIKCAFPFMHNWLQDAYPEATVTGTVFLSAFTTKLAVYALARGFAGTDILIPIGAVMTIFPLFYAVIENDLRRVLAYSLNNQLGFMVVGVGIGTEMALNGTAAHAFAHILYKGLLFMAVGAVLFRTGTAKASELGGLYKSMPLTAALCIVGSLSIAGFPLFSGFVSKAMVLSAVAEGHWVVLSLVLLFASAGVVDHSGIKVPFFAFFAHDNGWRVKEAPLHMLLAMGLAAALCLGIGLFPGVLYSILPYPVEYAPYTTGHVLFSLQLLLFASLAFALLYRRGWYPPELRALNLDTDWFYRRAGPAVIRRAVLAKQSVTESLRSRVSRGMGRTVEGVGALHRPSGIFGEPWPIGYAALWVAVILAVVLVQSFL